MWGLILKPAMFGVCVGVYWVDTAVLSESDLTTFIIIIEPALLNCTRHIIVFVVTQSTQSVPDNTLTNLKWKTTKLCLSELETVVCE